jgi:hypothetical protein
MRRGHGWSATSRSHGLSRAKCGAIADFVEDRTSEKPDGLFRGLYRISTAVETGGAGGSDATTIHTHSNFLERAAKKRHAKFQWKVTPTFYYRPSNKNTDIKVNECKLDKSNRFVDIRLQICNSLSL